MLEALQEQATLYTLGLLDPGQAAEFEHQFIGDEELRRLVEQLHETQATLAVAGASLVKQRPSAEAWEKISQRIDSVDPVLLPEVVSQALAESKLPLPEAADGVVFSDRDGFVNWINPAFCRICGHALEDLSNKKLGPILQGPGTDPAAAANLRNAIQSRKPVRETILNYHKSGEPYFVDLDIRPVRAGFIALARKRDDPPVDAHLAGCCG